MRSSPFCLSVVLLSIIARPLLAQDWNRFRGPNGTGLTDTALPAQWSESELKWKIPLPGTGHSSPVFFKARLFLTCADKESAKRIVLCVSADDGKLLWQRDFPSRTYRMHADNHYASSSPAVDADHVYVCWTTPDEYTLTALTHDGKDVWRINLGAYTSQHGSGVSPIVFEDLVILTNDQEGPTSFILAVDRKTGQQRWKLPRRSTHMAAATPCLYQPPGKDPQLILASRTEGITAVDPRTGKVLWQAADVLTHRVVASPVIAGDIVIAHGGEGGIGRIFVAVRIPTSPTPPSVLYKFTSQIPYVPTPVVKNDLLFTLTDAGLVTCRRASTGQTLGEQRIGGSYYSSPVCAADKLYCISKKGEIVALSADEKLQVLGRTQLNDLCYSTPAISNGRMYVHTFNHLICLGR